MSHSLLLDVHHYDSWVRENFIKIKPLIPNITPVEFELYKNEILEAAQNFNDHRVSYAVHTVFNKNDVDINTNFHCNTLAAAVWKIAKEKDDGKTVFLLQYLDMFLTNGYCPMGQTQRYLQVLLAFV